MPSNTLLLFMNRTVVKHSMVHHALLEFMTHCDAPSRTVSKRACCICVPSVFSCIPVYFNITLVFSCILLCFLVYSLYSFVFSCMPSVIPCALLYTLCILLCSLVYPLYSLVYPLYSLVFSCIPSSFCSFQEMIELLREVLVHILHTKDGSRVALQCIWHGNTKVCWHGNTKLWLVWEH